MADSWQAGDWLECLFHSHDHVSATKGDYPFDRLSQSVYPVQVYGSEL